MSSCVAPRSKCHWTADLSTKGLLAGLEAKKHRLGRCSPRIPAGGPETPSSADALAARPRPPHVPRRSPGAVGSASQPECSLRTPRPATRQRNSSALSVASTPSGS